MTVISEVLLHAYWLLVPPVIWIVVVSLRHRIFPTRTFAVMFVLPGVLSLSLAGNWNVNYLLQVVLLIDLVILGIALWDQRTVVHFTHVDVERKLAPILSVGQRDPVTLQLSNHGPREVDVAVRDDVPREMEAEPEEFELRLAPRSRAEVTYHVRPTKRGARSFEHVFLRFASPLRLWQAYQVKHVPQNSRVLPNLKQLGEYAALARTNRLSLMGLRRTRRVGQDHDFERLREFTRDDNFKHIDWRATARRRRLIVKDFQASQSQRLIVMLDCGRMMTNEADGLSLLDHAINASLMLSHIALVSGDAVGMLTFSDRIHGYVPPREGRHQMTHLLHSVYDRHATMVESRYDEAFKYVSRHCRRRSLVILISNVIDEVNGNQIKAYLGALSGHHLPLAVLLRDRRVFQFLDPPANEGQALYRSAAAAEIVHWRYEVLADLRQQGALMLDLFPESITAPLINQYLEVKARHLL